MPKGHAVHHMLAFVFLWGAIDNARLNNFEHDHTTWVKKAVRRTRMHLKTMIHELEGATDRIMAARYVKGLAAEWVAEAPSVESRATDLRMQGHWAGSFFALTSAGLGTGRSYRFGGCPGITGPDPYAGRNEHGLGTRFPGCCPPTWPRTDGVL